MNEPMLAPRLIALRLRDPLAQGLASLALGVALLSLLAQIALPLPFTPVPLTGQTFGVALTALLFGRRAPGIVAVYLFLGALGLPVLAGGRAGVSWGPTLGYLGGMLVAAFVTGWLAERGWARTWRGAWLAATLGSACTFAGGLWVLSFFVPGRELLVAGLLPFLPGDFLKNSLAALIASRAYRAAERSC